MALGFETVTIGREDLLAWFAELERVYAGNRKLLTELDAAIGDADHGINMDRGFKAVAAALASDASTNLKGTLEGAARVLIRTVGGASGPLYGTFFLRAASACADRQTLEEAAVVDMFQAGVEGVRQRGKAAAGDKTMLDALLPAVDAMRQSLADGGDLTATLRAGAAAAEHGMHATTPMKALKGRASYLGERSIGHQDPGATSAWLLIDAAARVWPARA